MTRRAALALVAVGLSGCSMTSGGLWGGLETSPGSVDPARAARLISAYRASRGLGPVKPNAKLNRIAQNQARQMARADKLAHELPGEPPFLQRIAAGGYDAHRVAENIGAGYKSLDSAITRWRNSPGHDRNLLLPEVTEIGIGTENVPESRYGSYWSLVLARPLGPTPPGYVVKRW